IACRRGGSAVISPAGSERKREKGEAERVQDRSTHGIRRLRSATTGWGWPAVTPLQRRQVHAIPAYRGSSACAAANSGGRVSSGISSVPVILEKAPASASMIVSTEGSGET